MVSFFAVSTTVQQQKEQRSLLAVQIGGNCGAAFVGGRVTITHKICLHCVPCRVTWRRTVAAALLLHRVFK